MANFFGQESLYPEQGMISSGPPPTFDPMRMGGPVAARWTYPYAGYSQPILELPQQKFLRISLAVNAFLGEPIINSAAKLTIFLALERMITTVTCNVKNYPDWVPKEMRERLGSDPSIGTASYVKRKCLQLAEHLDIKSFFEEVALDILVAGDGFVNIASNAVPEEELSVMDTYDLQARKLKVKSLQDKMKQDGRGAYWIYKLQALNPSACWLYPDYTGVITHAKVVHLLGEGVWDVPLSNLIHLKHFTFPWTVYGLSAYIAALKWVDIKFKFMEAMYVNAARYVNPREWLEIKGPNNEHDAALPPTESQMNWAMQILGAYQSGVPYVLPGGWDWKMLGAEGKVLKTEQLMEYCDGQIRTASSISKTFTSGESNVPAFATSLLQAGVMYKMIEPLQRLIARAIEGRIFGRYCLFNGFLDDDGELIAPKVRFDTLPIQGDTSLDTKVQILYDRGLLSPLTAWEMEGIDPTLEIERMKKIMSGQIEPFSALAPDEAPDQNPSRAPLTPNVAEATRRLTIAKMQGYKRLLNRMATAVTADINDDRDVADKAFRDVGKYAAESALMTHSNAQNRLDHALTMEEQFDMNKQKLEETGGTVTVESGGEGNGNIQEI